LNKGQGHALVIIDPQNDFCDHRGSLYVEGAEDDISRLAGHISRTRGKYSDIFVSLDSHDPIAIFHPKFWLDENGANPAPFTAITGADYRDGRLRTANRSHERYAEKIFDAMAKKNAASLMIWPEHCVVSTWGHGIPETLKAAFSEWRQTTGKPIRYIFKGENPYTEQFSIFEGLDDSWPDTTFNEELFSALAEFGSVTYAGEALSHCVAESITSYVSHGESILSQKKFVLSDCVSPVSGFDRSESENRLTALGIRFIPS